MKTFTANLENPNEQEKETLLRLIQKSEGFTEKSLELLKKLLPKNPCSTCNIAWHYGVACCDCAEGSEYLERVKPYKELGIYDIACELRDIASMEKEIKEKQKEVADMKAKLPKEIRQTFFQEDYAEHGGFGGVWSL